MLRMRGWVLGLIGSLLLSPALAADLKVGYVNASALLQASPQAEVVQKKLRDEFKDTKALHLPIQSILRVEEVEKRGTAAIRDAASGDKITPFPMIPPKQG